MRRPPAALRDVFAMCAALERRLPAAHRPLLLPSHRKLPESQPDPRGFRCFPAAGHQEKEVRLDQPPPHH